MQFNHNKPKVFKTGDRKYITKFAWARRTIHRHPSWTAEEVDIWLERYIEVWEYFKPQSGGDGWWHKKFEIEYSGGNRTYFWQDARN